ITKETCMKTNWHRIATTLGFVACLAMIAPACMVRAGGAVRVRPVLVVDEPPPPSKHRTVAARPGYVWIKGHYEYRGGSWVWMDGHWERQRSGYYWEEGRWVRRGNRWHWVEGRWVRGNADVHVRTQPAPVRTSPPPPRAEPVRTAP